MATINLLPWREERLRELKRQYVSVLVSSAVLTGLVILLVHFSMAERIESQTTRNQILKTEIARLDKQIKEIKTLEKEKQSLMDRMDVVAKLESTRNDVVYLLSELVNTLPSGVYLTRIVQSGKTILLDGLAQSNSRVSEFMRTLDESEHFADPRLSRIDAARVGAVNGSKFSLKVNQQYKR